MSQFWKDIRRSLRTLLSCPNFMSGTQKKEERLVVRHRVTDKQRLEPNGITAYDTPSALDNSCRKAHRDCMDKSAPRAMRYSNLPRVRRRAQSASIAARCA